MSTHCKQIKIEQIKENLKSNVTFPEKLIKVHNI